ncbi:MAG: trypsin-like peptidase domain-containing protein [bacterium]|nr:trypsin-like peptidase domain-containing protein [bacterium]
MTYRRESPHEFSVEELDRELIRRGAQNPGGDPFKFKEGKGNEERECIMKGVKKLLHSVESLAPIEALRDISTADLSRILLNKVRERNVKRGVRGTDERLDLYEVPEEKIKRNANCTGAIFMRRNLKDNKDGTSTLEVERFQDVFNLCDLEPFNHQPVAAGRSYSCVLVEEDVIATAGHCAKPKNLKELRITFGFKMEDSSTVVTTFSNNDIYKGTKIIGRMRNRGGNQEDWALVKLDRKVENIPVATLSGKAIRRGTGLYILGHPAGLPMKYAPGPCVGDINGSYFVADLDVYSGNSGSPVFDCKTHELVGIVCRGDSMDFRWSGCCWFSIVYDNFETHSKIDKYNAPECTRVSEFRDVLLESSA